MKKLLIILMFVPLVSFGQQAQAVVNKISVDNTSNVERALVTSEPKTKIIVPIEVDFNNYTHLVFANIESFSGSGRKVYKLYQERLSSSPLAVLNPYEVDIKKAKKNHTFLKTLKNPKYLYLNYYRAKGSGNDDVGTRVIVRDYKNKIVYSAQHTNIDMGEILYPFIGF